jgi:hypothetical protein
MKTSCMVLDNMEISEYVYISKYDSTPFMNIAEIGTLTIHLKNAVKLEGMM